MAKRNFLFPIALFFSAITALPLTIYLTYKLNKKEKTNNRNFNFEMYSDFLKRQQVTNLGKITLLIKKKLSRKKKILKKLKKLKKQDSDNKNSKKIKRLDRKIKQLKTNLKHNNKKLNKKWSKKFQKTKLIMASNFKKQ